MPRLIALVLTTLLVSACDPGPDPIAPTTDSADFARGGVPGRPTGAVVRFGDPNTGSPFPPSEFHDASYHAYDKLVPRNVVIPVGGTVTFEVAPVHVVAIYDANVAPSDIDTSLTQNVPGPFPPGFLLVDPNNRLAFQGTDGLFTTRTYQYTFTAPGRYLVICAITPHFVLANMYGWVTVQ